MKRYKEKRKEKGENWSNLMQCNIYIYIFKVATLLWRTGQIKFWVIKNCSNYNNAVSNK